MHQLPVIFRRRHKRLGRRLPFLEVLFAPRQLHDVGGGIAQSQQLAPTR